MKEKKVGYYVLYTYVRSSTEKGIFFLFWGGCRIERYIERGHVHDGNYRREDRCCGRNLLTVLL